MKVQEQTNLFNSTTSVVLNHFAFLCIEK